MNDKIRRSKNRTLNNGTLYVGNSYLKKFKATVIRSGPGFLILDRTAFYPQSGGQPSDTGFLYSEEKKIRVFKVLKRGSEIFHYVKNALPKGVTVQGVIDWDARLLNMRRHSAEHLLTSLFEKIGAGPKVYSDLKRLEFKPSNITEESLKQVETDFNKVIEADIPIRIYYTEKNKLDVGEDERKKSFLGKIPRNIDYLRMVEIQGYAPTFCFGTHVRSTGEIGRIFKLDHQKGKKSRSIVHFSLE